MSGQRTINLGIKIGTDLQPFVKELERLKGIITSLGTSRQTFNDLAGATMQWSRAVGDLNTKLDQTIQKMGQLGAFPAAMQNLGAVMPQKIQVIAGAAGATGMVAGAPVTPTNAFAAFNKSHRMMLSRAMGLARAVDTTVADINYEPHLIRARNIARFLDERARYSDNDIARARTSVSKLESSYWTQGFISRSAKAGRIVNEDDAEAARRVQLEHARQRLAGMQLANDSLNKLHDTLSARREMHQSFLQKQGMTGVRLFNAATREDQRREEAVQTTGRRYVRAWRQAHLEDRRRDEAEQREGRTAIRTWNAAYSEDANREAQVQRAGQSQLRIIRMAEAEDQFRSELPQRQGMAQARLLGAAYREDQRRDQAVQRNGMMFTRTWNQAHAENTKREAQVQKEGMANLRVLRMAQEEDSYRNELPTIEGMRQARIVGAAYREKERRETAQQASGMRFERVWTAAHAENLKRSQAPFVARMHAIDATTAENKAQRQMLAGLARLDHQDAMVQARLQREGMQGVRMVNQAYAEDQRRTRAPYVAQMQALDAASKERAAERRMENDLARRDAQDANTQRRVQLSGMQMARIRQQAGNEYRRRLVDPWMQQFNNQLTDTRELMGDIAEERQSGTLTPTTQAKAEARIKALRQQRADLRAIRGGAKVAGYAPLTEKEANQVLDKVNAQLKGMNTALKENESGWSSALKSALGFGSAVAGINSVIRGLHAMYAAAREVDEAFARIRATVSRMPSADRATAFKSITTGAMEDMLRTGMSLTDTANINTAAYLGSRGTALEKRALARTMTNMHYTGALNSEETMGMIPVFNNAGFGAGETRAFFERANVLQGSLNLDQQRMRAFMVATSAGMPAVGSTQSWEDTQAWALQEAAASRDMVMGSKLNRIQIALQNPRTLRRLNEILGKRGERTSIGGMDIESMLNSGNPMQTIGKLQTLYEQGHLNDAEITKVGQTLDMWNSPGTIQILKGGLEPYRKKIREADALTRAGVNSTDEAAREQAQSLGATMDRMGAAFKALFVELTPMAGVVKTTISAFTTLIAELAKQGTAVKVITSSLMAAVATYGLTKGLQFGGAQLSTAWTAMRSTGVRGAGLAMLGTLGAIPGAGWAAAALVGAGMVSSHYADKRQESANQASEENRVGAARVVLDLDEQASGFQKLIKAANEYQSLLDQQKGSSEEAKKVRDRILALSGHQLKAEQLTLGVLNQQKLVLLEQMEIKGKEVKSSFQSKRELLSEGMLYQSFQQSAEMGAHSTVMFPDNSKETQDALAGQVYLAKGAASKEVRDWAAETEQARATTKNPEYTNLWQSRKLAEILMIKGGISTDGWLEDPDSVFRSDKWNARQQELITAGGGKNARLVRNRVGWTTGASSTALAGAVRQNASVLNQYSSEIQMVDTSLQSERGQLTDSEFLTRVSTELATKSIPLTRAVEMVEARAAKMNPEQRKAFELSFTEVIKANKTEAYALGAKKGQVLGAYNTAIPAELEKVMSNPELREKHMVGFGSLQMQRAEALAQIERSMSPTQKSPGGKLDMDTGKDPFSAYRRLEQLAKQASQTGDFGTLLGVFSNSAFTPDAIERMTHRQLANIRQDAVIKMDKPRLEVEELAIKSGSEQAKNFVGAFNRRKLMFSAFGALMKGGYEHEGKLLMPGEQELVEQVSQEMGTKPSDFEGEQLYNLRLAEKVAQRKRAMVKDGTLSKVIAHMIDQKDAGGKFLFPEDARTRAHASIDASMAMLAPDLDADEARKVKDRVMREVQTISNNGAEGLNSMRLASGVRGMFGNEYQQQQDLYNLTAAEINIKRDMLAKMRESADTRREQLALEQQILELTLKQYGSIEQVQRVMANQKEGRAFSQAVIGELFAGDAKDRLPKLGNMMLTSVNRGVASQMNRVMDQMDKTGALGGIGNPLAALGRALYDPSGEMEGKDIQRAILDTARLQVQATQANTAAVQANTAARSGQTPPTTPSGGGAGPAIPIPGGAGATNAMTQGGNMPVYNIQGAPVAEGLVGGADQGSAWAPWAAAGAGALGGMGLGSLIGGNRTSGAVGAGLGAGMGMFMYYGAKGNRNAGRVATLNTSNGPLMVRQGRLGAGEAQKITKESGMSGDGTAYFYSQLGMTTPGVNWFSKENITGYMKDGSPANITGGLWKTDEYGRATGKVNWTSAAAGAANIGMSAYAGYMSQRGNGQAAQNWQLLSSGLGAASAMAGGATLFGGAAAATASTAAGLYTGGYGALTTFNAAGGITAGTAAATTAGTTAGTVAGTTGASTAGTLGTTAGGTASTGVGVPVAIVLAIAAIAASVMAGVAAAEHQAEEQNKAYREKEAEMMRLLAIAEEQRRSVGAAAERILSARADVNEVFSGVAASAFLSGRYSQTAPTIHVDNLVVQANNPAELSAALAQGVAREIRRGA